MQVYIHWSILLGQFICTSKHQSRQFSRIFATNHNPFINKETCRLHFRPEWNLGWFLRLLLLLLLLLFYDMGTSWLSVLQIYWQRKTFINLCWSSFIRCTLLTNSKTRKMNFRFHPSIKNYVWKVFVYGGKLKLCPPSFFCQCSLTPWKSRFDPPPEPRISSSEKKMHFREVVKHALHLIRNL